jgi:hypothetical protein
MKAKNLKDIPMYKTNPQAVENAIKVVEVVQLVVKAKGENYVITKSEAMAIAHAVIRSTGVSVQKIAESILATQ